jgi:hypothetical protein
VSDISNIAGWAGDLQTMIYDLKRDTWGTTINKNARALEIIKSNNSKINSTFRSDDMLADIDAENISRIAFSSTRLSGMLTEYYSKYVGNRYTLFVNRHGGLGKLNTESNKYTRYDYYAYYTDKVVSPYSDMQHSFLLSYAKAAATDFSFKPAAGILLINKTASSRIVNPEQITLEESNALTYAFIEFLRGKI